eukprot:1161825-Pelagomonas_calceolata.AAC.5
MCCKQWRVKTSHCIQEGQALKTAGCAAGSVKLRQGRCAGSVDARSRARGLGVKSKNLEGLKDQQHGIAKYAHFFRAGA